MDINKGATFHILQHRNGRAVVAAVRLERAVKISLAHIADFSVLFDLGGSGDYDIHLTLRAGHAGVPDIFHCEGKAFFS